MLVRTYNEYIADFSSMIDSIPTIPPRDKLLANELKQVTKNLRSDQKLPPQAIDKVKNLFLRRETEVATGQYLYTSVLATAMRINAPWLDLAKKLCRRNDRAALFNFHYYQLLFSSAKNINGMDYIQIEPMIKLGLNELFYSSKNKMLLSLESGLQCAEANHGKMGFYIVDETSERGIKSYWYELDADELQQVSLTNPRASERLSLLKRKKENCDDGKNLSFITIFVLSLLIDCSFFGDGLNGKYSELQRDQAEEAYKAFLSFLNIITEQERNFLMGQIIYNQGRGVLFEHLWTAATLAAVCVTWANQDIASLVLDYESEHPFINASLASFLPLGRRNKTYSDNSPFETKQQVIAVAVLINSLMPIVLDRNQKRMLVRLCCSIESDMTSVHDCLSFTQSCIRTLKSKLKDASAENASTIQRKLLTKASLITPANAQRIICYQLMLFQFELGGALNFFELLPDICKETLFPLKIHKIAFGFLIIKQFQELGENSGELNRHILTLFELLSQQTRSPVNTSDVELKISELINVFISTANRKSSDSIKRLVGKVAELNEKTTRETLTFAGVEKLIDILCTTSNRSDLENFTYKDKNKTVIDLAKLKLDVLKETKELEVDDFSTMITRCFNYLCFRSGYSFQQTHIDQANEFMSQVSGYIRPRTSSFDL